MKDALIEGARSADLHLHTVFSDGTYTPQELIAQALKNGLSTVSVVDHDTVRGIEPALKIGRREGVEVLPGIELTAEHDGLELHILGYLIDYKDKAFLEKLDFLRESRIARIHKIVDKLEGMGLNLKADSVIDFARKGTVGRLHIARAMVKEGLVKNVYEAFKKYIGDRSPAYVCGFRFSPPDAIKLIRRIGGIPVLAHPYTIRRDELIPQLVHSGLMGLEVYYPEHTQSMINFYLRLAAEYDLLVTGGSDCHGSAKPEAKIGSIRLPYEFVEKLKAAKAGMKG